MKQYVADAFTDHVFSGNPAAVCVLDQWLPDETMKHITVENNLSETAFVVKEGDHYRLRWFTPGGEIDLCGHATLGTAFILSRFYDRKAEAFAFDTLSGRLTVTKEGELFTMDFPAYDLKEIPVTDAMEEAFAVRPVAAFMGRDLLAVLPTEEDVRSYKPDLPALSALPGLLQHITARGKSPFDCVSRSFAPKLSVPEDPVCGSGHCHIIPYWAGVLKKESITAFQASPRSGILYGKMKGHRLLLSGKAVLWSEAEIHV